MTAYEIAANYILSKTSYRPEVGIICGSGLSNLSKQLTNSVTINYEDIPGFPEATVPGHFGELVFGLLGSIQCVCMRGRFHFYEGNAMSTVVMPVRAMRLIGVKLLIVTNAAGGLNPEFSVGDVMIIQDYFALPCMSGNNPLVGTNDDALGPRFPSVSDAFDEAIQDIVLKVGSDLGYSNSLRPNGTYCFVSGPQYESKAEARFLRSIGGDSVGMSTIPEVIAAKHCGMKILGLSLITNKVLVGKSDLPPASHAEVLAAVEQSGKRVEALVKAIASTKELKDYIDKQPNFIYKPSKKSSTAKDNHHTSKSGTASTRNSLFENSALLLTSVAAAVLVTIAVGKIRL